MTEMKELKDGELKDVSGGIGIDLRNAPKKSVVQILTLCLHATEIYAGIDHPVYAQIQKCIDTFWEGRLIRDEVEIAINMLLTMEEIGNRNNIIAGLNDALIAHAEPTV